MDENIARLLGNVVIDMDDALVLCAAEPIDLAGAHRPLCQSGV